MNESSNEDPRDEAEYKRVLEFAGDLCYDIVEALSYDELQELADAPTFDDLYKLIEDNGMLQQIFKTCGGDNFDAYARAIEWMASKEKVSTYSLDEIIALFKEQVLDIDHDIIVYHYIEKKSGLRKILCCNFPLVGIKKILDFLEDYCKEYSVRHSDYDGWLNCECGHSFKHLIQLKNGSMVDHRTIISCCAKCGRSRASWVLTSARSIILVKRTTKKFWFFSSTTEITETNIGLVTGNHKQFDADRHLYNGDG
jgi:hypothetical protein